MRMMHLTSRPIGASYCSGDTRSRPTRAHLLMEGTCKYAHVSSHDTIAMFCFLQSLSDREKIRGYDAVKESKRTNFLLFALGIWSLMPFSTRIWQLCQIKDKVLWGKCPYSCAKTHDGDDLCITFRDRCFLTKRFFLYMYLSSWYIHPVSISGASWYCHSFSAPHCSNRLQ